MLWEFQIWINLWFFFLNQKKISKYWNSYYYKRIYKKYMPFLTKNKYMYFTSIYEKKNNLMENILTRSRKIQVSLRHILLKWIVLAPFCEKSF